MPSGRGTQGGRGQGCRGQPLCWSTATLEGLGSLSRWGPATEAKADAPRADVDFGAREDPWGEDGAPNSRLRPRWDPTGVNALLWIICNDFLPFFIENSTSPWIFIEKLFPTTYPCPTVLVSIQSNRGLANARPRR